MNALIVIIVIISIFLIILVYLQSARAKTTGTSIIGNESLELFENTKVRGMEKFLLISTWVLVFLFFLLVLLTHII